MLDREACERRVYRLATLLTGNPVAAARVIAHVVDAQPDLRNLDSAHMDRLTVLRSREITPAALAADSAPTAAAMALAALPAQQREAWVFARIYRLQDREIARAMDCSVTATQRHMEQADAVLAARLGPEATTAPQLLRAYSMSLDVPAFYRVEQRRRRHVRIALFLIAAAGVALLIAAIVQWWGRPLSWR